MYEEIKKYLNSLDAKPRTVLNEFDVANGIKAVIDTRGGERPVGEALYELLAFDLYPRHEGHVSEWGTRFGSHMTFRDEKTGEMVEYPPKNLIDVAAIEYWAKRAEEAKHPILVERYADLVFDLSELVGKKVDRAIAQLVVDSIIEIVQSEMVEDTYKRLKLHRALALAKMVGDSGRFNRLVAVIVDTERKTAIDNKPGLWGFSFEWLVLGANNTYKVDESLSRELLKDLEERLSRLLAQDDPEPWTVERAVKLLLEHYVRCKQEQDATRVLLSLEDAFRKNARSNSDPMLKAAYLEHLDQLYRQHARLPNMREHMERITKELPVVSKESVGSFQKISTELKIDQKEIEDYVNAIFSATRDGKVPSLGDIKVRIISHFLGRKEEAAKLVEKFSKEFVFMHIVSRRHVAEEGHTEAIVAPYREDPESHIVSQAFQGVQISNIFLAETMKKFRNTFRVEEVAAHLHEGRLFQEEDREYLLRGLKSYWGDDPFSASHVFIPYIEMLIRRLVAKSGGMTLRPNEHGGYSYKTLGELLAKNSHTIDSIFGGEVTFYLKLILTHPLGWNVRNNYAHGANLNALFRQDIADRLLHIILLLSLVVEKQKED